MSPGFTALTLGRASIAEVRLKLSGAQKGALV
jgi:hypothetical protein